MSATPTEPIIPAPTAPAPTEPPAAPAPETPPPAQETDWKAEARKWEGLAKANNAAAKKLAEIEEASKTEAQKMADRLAAAEKTAAEATLRALRADVAQAKGVPAALLSGNTQEALEASADALIAFRGEQKPAIPAAPPAAGQGKNGEPVGAGAPQLTADDLARMTAAKDYDGIAKATAEGRFDTLLGTT